MQCSPLSSEDYWHHSFPELISSTAATTCKDQASQQSGYWITSITCTCWKVRRVSVAGRLCVHCCSAGQSSGRKLYMRNRRSRACCCACFGCSRTECSAIVSHLSGSGQPWCACQSSLHLCHWSASLTHGNAVTDTSMQDFRRFQAQQVRP
jgi:hypothetical protein